MKKQIVMFGGCFNPPLNSHFSLADQVANEYEEIEKIVKQTLSEKRLYLFQSMENTRKLI